MACPGALFFQFAYSESIFLFLCLLALIFIERGQNGKAAGAAFLLAVCRPQGILAAPALWYAWAKQPGGRREIVRNWAFLAAPLAGYAAYLGIMKAATGSALDGFRVFHDLYPFAPSPLKIFDLREFLAALTDLRCVHGYLGSLLDRLWLIPLFGALWAMARRERLYFAYTAAVGLIPAVTLSFISYTRYFVLAFPVFIVAGEALAHENRAWPRRLLIGAMIGVQAILLIRHANNYWAG